MENRTAAAARLMRTMRIAFFVSGLLFIAVILRAPAHPPAPLQPKVALAMLGLAMACAAMGFMAVPLLGSGIQRAAQAQPGFNPMQPWLSGCLLSLAFFEACELFGVVLHFLGAAPLFVAIPFAAGLGSQLVWKPQAAPDVPAV